MAPPGFLRRLLRPVLSQEPANELIRQTARQQWRLVGLNLCSTLVEAFTEGATLGVVFLAVQVITPATAAPFNWASFPLLGSVPSLVAWLNGLPANTLFLSLLVLAVILQALQSVTRFVNQVSVGYFAARCKALVTSRIHSQVLAMSFPCASGYKVGDLAENAAQGPEAIRIEIAQISAILVGVLLCITYLIVLLRLSPLLLLAVIAMGAMITLLQKQLVPRIQSGSMAVMQAQVAVNSRVIENFQGLRLLHTSGQRQASAQHVRSGMGELEHLLRRQTRRQSVVGPFTSFLPILTITLIAALSVLLLGGRSTGVLPSLVTFVLALQKLNSRMGILAINFNELADNTGRFERLNNILSSVDKDFCRVGGLSFVALKREICFEGVTLQYASDLVPAIQDVSFTLPRGQMLALVGPSGAGKSSIADLLTGLYSPTSGRILIDGVNIDSLDLESWQQRLGVVSQDTFLFNATVQENIAFGTPGVSRAQIESACSAAQAAGFIENMPQGYDTLVGERGYRLSGGQRQRLSLARAILRDPELLILDEATSALDSQSERLVQEAIERFERNHTVLVIAHRLSTIVRADQILVLERGRIVQRGTHASLLSTGGRYKSLWDLQQANSLMF